jgi:hypothetical protein
MPPIALSDYSQTPTALPPAPRRVRARFGIFGWIVTIVYLATLLWSAGYLLLLLCTLYLGVDIPAQIVNVRTSHSNRHGTSYGVDFIYKLNGHEHDGSASIPEEMFHRFDGALRSRDAKERQVTIRNFAAGPFKHVDFTPNSQLLSDLPLPLLIIALLFIFRFLLYTQVWLLYRYGNAVTGVIHGKRIRTTRNSTYYYLAYSFPDPNGGGEIKKEFDCGRRVLYNAAHTGDRITVLYSVRRAVPYEYGPCRVVLPDGTAPLHAAR